MADFTIKFLPSNTYVGISAGTTILEAERIAGFMPDAPCGGEGTCGKCMVRIFGPNGSETVKACRTVINSDLTVELLQSTPGHRILVSGALSSGSFNIEPEGKAEKTSFAIAFDIGTTTIVAYLADRFDGRTLATASTLNPQTQFGADVISRASYAIENGGGKLESTVKTALNSLISEVSIEAEISKDSIDLAVIVGNTCMHHLLLGLSPQSLVVAPYSPVMTAAMELSPSGIVDINPAGIVRILPIIAGFVGADTVGVMLATKFDTLEKITLAIDIGTNGELVLGNKSRAIACSTAAGPAFEGAKIACGMRAAEGAIDHVSVTDGEIEFHTIGGSAPRGICGSGLLDLVAALLETGAVDDSGRLTDSETLITVDGVKAYPIFGNVYISQKDIREVQLAKAAIAAGIELLAKHLGIKISDIESVLIAGAFGNYMNPASACRIGLIPAELSEKITTIGNAAGEGARRAALSSSEWRRSQEMAKQTEFLELASDVEFQDIFVDNLAFSEV